MHRPLVLFAASNTESRYPARVDVQWIARAAPSVPRMSVFVVVVSTSVTRDTWPLALIASDEKLLGNACVKL